ncbi:hypothetical protein L218DRAFT_949255 [Marasmius fiardii PR-910]|nr:hypothetical protein L218DRAFT_949255 [Marasmius fiardii PR-910]
MKTARYLSFPSQTGGLSISAVPAYLWARVEHIGDLFHTARRINLSQPSPFSFIEVYEVQEGVAQRRQINRSLESIGQGGWLVGIRRAWSLSNLDSGGTEGDDNNNSESDVEKDAKIRQLSELAARQLPPTPLPTSKHLLLCLAPVGSYVSLSEEDAGFDIIPSQIRCTFKSGVFVFPEPDQDNTFLHSFSSESGSERKQSQLKGHSSKPDLIPSSISSFSKRSLGHTTSIGSQVSELPVAAVRRGLVRSSLLLGERAG